MQSEARPRTPGRPRSDVTRRAILNAAFELLADRGVSGFTIEGVAARSGVARTTIYRWWSSKGALAMEGFLETTAPQIAFPHTASAIADIKAQLRLVAKALRGRMGRIVCGIIAEGQSDPDTIEAFVEGYIRPRREEARTILRRGIDAGELRPDLDIDVALDALYPPLYLRLLLRHGPLDDAWVDRLSDLVLSGCRVHQELPVEVAGAV
jgi:AcrR family transcriptional regulator